LEFGPRSRRSGPQDFKIFWIIDLMKTHYDILGVAPDADYETIKTAY
jgi:DnaJ-class molecular chaperone